MSTFVLRSLRRDVYNQMKISGQKHLFFQAEMGIPDLLGLCHACCISLSMDFKISRLN